VDSTPDLVDRFWVLSPLYLHQHDDLTTNACPHLQLPHHTMPASQMGFGDVQVPGPLAPPVPDAAGEGARVAVEVDLTHIPQPPGSPVPLSVCADRAHRHNPLSGLVWPDHDVPYHAYRWY